MALSKTSTISLHRNGNKTYFRTAVPESIAIEMLGIRRDVKGQRLHWMVEAGRVVVKT